MESTSQAAPRLDSFAAPVGLDRFVSCNQIVTSALAEIGAALS